GAEGAWTLAYFTPMDAEGLIVLPYHRLLDRAPALAEARPALASAFEITDVRGAAAAAREAARSTASYAFALVEADGAGLLAQSRPGAEALMPASAAPSLRALDTFFLPQAVLPKLLHVPEAA